MYAATGVLAALHHVQKTGEGQHIDLAMVDTRIAWLINEGTNYLTSGAMPQRRDIGHPNIVPYKAFQLKDGHAVVAVRNDGQFQRFATWVGAPDWATDSRFATNPARIEHREVLVDLISEALRDAVLDDVISSLERIGVPVGPVNTLDRVFASDQVAARQMAVGISSDHASNGTSDLLGNPLKFSKTSMTYRKAPPKLGEHTNEILNEI